MKANTTNTACLTTFIFCILSFASKAQSQLSYDVLFGISPNTGATFTSEKGYQNIFGGGLVSYQISKSPWTIISGFEMNFSQNTPDFLRIPVKANYYIGEHKTFFFGAGASYNYTISAFANRSKSFDALLEAGAEIALNASLSLVPRVSYSYGLEKIAYNENSDYRINYLMVSLALRFHPSKKY